MYKKISDIRLQVPCLLLVVLSAFFWNSSRYPSLDSKNDMAGDFVVADGLSFDAAIAHKLSESIPENILTTFVNWLHTNQQGMLFGLAFALLTMTILSVVRDDLDRWITRKTSAAFAGALLGSPLGVCVNCAAPIGYGLYRNGARLEMSLATMISSPTLNIIVLSMALALFPLYLVAIKLVATLLIIFILIPLLGRYAQTERYSQELAQSRQPDTVVHEQHGLMWLVHEMFRNTLVLIKNVIPLMLLAGFIGSVLIVLLPWESITAQIQSQNTLLSWLGYLLTASFCLILPVPMAFDIIIVAAMLNAGLPAGYAAVMLITLGSYSIYSHMVLRKAGVKRTSNRLAIGIIIIATLAGVTTSLIDTYINSNIREPIYNELQSPKSDKHNIPAYSTLNKENLNHLSPGGGLHRDIPKDLPLESSLPDVEQISWESSDINNNIRYRPFTTQTESGVLFQQTDIKKLGLHHHFKPLLYNLLEPFASTNGLSAADINRDGWTDIALATANGLYIYLNNGGVFSYFARFKGDSQVSSLIAASALADVNNDGWPDLVFSEYGSGLWLAMNNQGQLTTPYFMPNSENRLAKSLSFYDLNNDGLLEIFVGNSDDLTEKRPSGPMSENLVYQYRDGKYQPLRIKNEVKATTLSSWVGDINNDKQLDLWIGNDFDEPDSIFTFRPETNKFSNIQPEVIQETTYWTMSLDSADINNDLKTEIYQAQITFNPSGGAPVIPQGREITAQHCQETKSEFCALSRALAKAREAQQKKDPSECSDLDRKYRLDCIANVFYWQQLIKLGEQQNKPAALQSAKPLEYRYPDLYRNFSLVSQVDRLSPKESEQRLQHKIPQNKQHNLLYFSDQNSVLENRAKDWNIHITGWAWNSRFADLNNDQWQDLFISNGHTTFSLETSNILYLNQQGETFSDVTAESGLEDFTPTLSNLYIDYDNDGDLDILTFSQTGKLTFYRNNEDKNSSIQIELVDLAGNFYGIGARIYIYYQDGEMSGQMRDIHLSGGYMSHNAPVAHFGLGDKTQIQRIEVQWPDKTHKVYTGPFLAGKRYQIIRNKE